MPYDRTLFVGELLQQRIVLSMSDLDLVTGS